MDKNQATKRLRLAGTRYELATKQVDVERDRLHQVIGEATGVLSAKEIAEASLLHPSRVRQIVAAYKRSVQA